MKNMKTFFSVLSITLILFFSCKKEQPTNNKEQPAGLAEEVADLKTGIDFKFTAYKTAKKVGVDGKFTNYTITGTGKGKNLQEKLTGAEVTIDPQSVETGDDARNNTLQTKFFKVLAGDSIKAKVLSFDGNKAKILLHLNQKEITKEFVLYPRTGNPNAGTLEAEIDLLNDFEATDAFNSIAEACKVLHEGKTWTDVKLTVNIDL